MNDPVGFSGKPWPQYREEIERFLALLVSEDIRSFLEIGCRYADTLHAAGCVMPKGARLVGVDWGQEFDPAQRPRRVRVPSEYRRGLQDRAIDRLKDVGHDARMVIGDSRDVHVVAEVKPLGPFDCVFIDAGHSIDAVTADWENYGPMARIVAFHDVCNDGRRLTGPGDLFQRLGRDYRHITISSDPVRRGIGVLWRE